MAKFFSSAVVRAILAFLAFILAALAVWFIGPLLALGEWRPLAGVGLRITTLCLMLVFVIFALLGWSLPVCAPGWRSCARNWASVSRCTWC